jgi:replicative DNA helicase
VSAANAYSQERSSPASVDAERSVLGGILLAANAYEEAAASGLTASDFSLDSNRRIYSRMVELAESSRPIDVITLAEELDRHKELVKVGDVGYISGLLDGVPDRPSVKHYVKIVREKSDQRKLIHACNATAAACSDGSSSRECIAELGERLLQIQTGSDDAPAERVLKFSDQVYTDWQQIADGDTDLIGLTTSVEALDLATTGIRPGEFWLVAGRTGGGKTAFALQIAAANCRAGIPTGFFSIEMSNGDLLQRLWSQEGRIPFQSIRNPRGIAPEMRARIKRAMAEVGMWPLFVVEDGSLSIQRLTAKARLMIRQEKIQLLIVDYVQLVWAPAKDERERLTKISNHLRTLAKETGVPIVAISQLNRPKDGNQNARPNKFSLKESGNLENDAHVILMTYLPVDEYGRPTGEDELIIAKQRHGPVSNERVFFEPKTLTFHERHSERRHMILANFSALVAKYHGSRNPSPLGVARGSEYAGEASQTWRPENR